MLKRCGPCYIYVGPNAFAAWERDQVAAFGGGSKVKKCNVSVVNYKVPKGLWHGAEKMRRWRYLKGQERLRKKEKRRM